MDELHNLQEIIASNPETLGEEFLIIQKEYHGFNDTNERLDLLALDKNKNLVVIENKLDDSGKDVTWQIIKYASYVSTFARDDIIKIFQEYLEKNKIEESAEEKLKEFYEIEDIDELILNDGNTSQRLILVSGNFRKEITSSVLWLMNYGLNIQCIKATPYKSDDKIFLDLQQIIPVKDVEEFTIKIVEKENKSKQVKNRINREYSESDLCENKTENICFYYEKIWDFVFKKNNNFYKKINQKYISFVENNRNWFRVYLKKDSIEIFTIMRFNLEERIEEIKNKTGINNINILQENKDQKKNGRGFLRFFINKENDLNDAYKIFDYYLENLSDEYKKVEKDYYKKNNS